MFARMVVGLLVAVALAGCGGDPPAGTVPEAAPSTAASVPRPVTPADARRCPVTPPRRFRPPPGVAADALFGAGSSHGNGKLWVGGLGDDGVIEGGPDYVEPDGSVGMKLGWWRAVTGRLRISGRRLDGPAPPLHADVPGGYGDRGFQASGVSFPTEGCWEVTGTAGTATLTFVSFVIKRGPGP
jgi:hypothetical protein